MKADDVVKNSFPCGAGREITHPELPGWDKPCGREAVGKVIIGRTRVTVLCAEHTAELDFLGVLDPPSDTP